MCGVELAAEPVGNHLKPRMEALEIEGDRIGTVQAPCTLEPPRAIWIPHDLRHARVQQKLADRFEKGDEQFKVAVHSRHLLERLVGAETDDSETQRIDGERIVGNGVGEHIGEAGDPPLAL